MNVIWSWLEEFRYAFLEYGWIAVLSFVMTYTPWLTPIKYAAISWLVLASKPPMLIFLYSTWWAVLWTMSLVFLHIFASDRIKKRLSIKKKRKWEHRLSMKESYGRTTLKNRQDKLFNHLHIVQKKRMLFLLTGLWTYSVIPDILVIWLTHKKLWTILFFTATVLGKSITNFLIVFGTDGVMKLFG